MTSLDVPIQRVRLADQAYDVLRTMILTRQLAPGERLSVPRLAEQLGLSRSPVREAVQRLVAEGLGVERLRRGAEVARIDMNELGEMYAVRAALEGLAAATVASRDRAELADVLPRLAEHLEAHRAAIEAEDDAGIIRADLAFHQEVLDAAGNGYLKRALNPIFGRSQIAMLSGDLASWPRHALSEHRRILTALRSGDPARAGGAARAHVDAVFLRHLARAESTAR
jgi:DNA-binding GntR family transcriptional regulator